MDPEEAYSPVSSSALFSSQGIEQQSPQKKLRVEESDCGNSLKDDLKDGYDSDDSYEDWVGRPMTEEEVSKYEKIVQESNGFDVDPLPSGVKGTNLIVPWVYFKEDPKLYNSSRMYSVLATEHYNKVNNTSFEFDDVEKINIEGFCVCTCYITFTATNMDDPGPEVKSKTFQAKVSAGIDSVVVESCNLKEVS